ncbi:MAG: response regulator [Patescibacteria group bacterium]
MSQKILLVEDDELMARMYMRILSYEGYTLETAANGQAGYEKAKTFQPNLILLDIMMPVLNGLQALEKLKKDPQTQACPVIMLTNLADKAEAELALQNGALKYVIKSDYDSDGLLSIVREVLPATD